MWTLKLKAKIFVIAIVMLIAADLMVGIPAQTRISVVVPQSTSTQN